MAKSKSKQNLIDDTSQPWILEYRKMIQWRDDSFEAVGFTAVPAIAEYIFRVGTTKIHWYLYFPGGLQLQLCEEPLLLVDPVVRFRRVLHDGAVAEYFGPLFAARVRTRIVLGNMLSIRMFRDHEIKGIVYRRTEIKEWPDE